MALNVDVRPSGSERNQPAGQATGQTPISSPNDQARVSTRQWIRACKISVGGGIDLETSNLRCQFQIRKMDAPQGTYAYVRVTNLSEETAKFNMLREFMTLTIEAGYVGRMGVIFRGQIMQKRKGKEPNGTDKYFDVLATSNHQAYGFSVVNKTLAAGHTYKDVVDEVVREFKKVGVEVGHIADLGSRKMPRAGVYFGMGRNILRDIGLATNTSWSIQDEKFQMVRNDGYLPGEAKVLNSNTGMIGLPEQTLDGIVVKCLIDPALTVGSRVHINQSSIQQAELNPTLPGGAETVELQRANLANIAADGIYRVMKVEHDGDTQGNQWYTTCTCIAPGDTSLAAGRAEKAAGFPSRGVAEEDDTYGSNNKSTLKAGPR